MSITKRLADATRTYLYGLNGAAVAMCRAILEAALKDCISEDELQAAPRGAKTPDGKTRRKGDLECMIDLAKQKRVLSPREHLQAHEVRCFGNDVMHDGREPNDHEAWQTLRKIRFILEDMCLHKSAQ